MCHLSIFSFPGTSRIKHPSFPMTSPVCKKWTNYIIYNPFSGGLWGLDITGGIIRLFDYFEQFFFEIIDQCFGVSSGWLPSNYFWISTSTCICKIDRNVNGIFPLSNALLILSTKWYIARLVEWHFLNTNWVLHSWSNDSRYPYSRLRIAF